jgi:hypothetical protein
MGMEAADRRGEADQVALCRSSECPQRAAALPHTPTKEVLADVTPEHLDGVAGLVSATEHQRRKGRGWHVSHCRRCCQGGYREHGAHPERAAE